MIAQYSVKDYSNYIFCSNNRNPLPIKQGNRRFAIFDANAIKRGDDEYFKKLIKLLEKAGKEGKAQKKELKKELKKGGKGTASKVAKITAKKVAKDTIKGKESEPLNANNFVDKNVEAVKDEFEDMGKKYAKKFQPKNKVIEKKNAEYDVGKVAKKTLSGITDTIKINASNIKKNGLGKRTKKALVQ
jgi:hypothetical protein